MGVLHGSLTVSRISIRNSIGSFDHRNNAGSRFGDTNAVIGSVSFLRTTSAELPLQKRSAAGPKQHMRQHQSTSSALAFATTTYTQCDWLPDALATGSNVADWTLRLDEASCVVRREASVCQRKWPSASALSICCSTQQLRFRCGSRKRNSRHETLIKAGRSASRLVLPVERTRSGDL